MDYTTKLMVEVAELYYENNLKQESIARKLNISKYQVCRILKQALEKGIVQIKINKQGNQILNNK